MTIQEPKQTLENRYKIEQELINTMAASVEDLAVYFGTTPSVIRKDLRNLHIEAGKGNESEIERLKIVRDEEIAEQLLDGKEKSQVLMDHGLWREPRSFKDIKLFESLNDKLQCLPDKREKLLALLELGWSAEDSIKRIGGLKNSDRIILFTFVRENKLSPKYAKEKDLEMNEIVQKTLQYKYQESIRNGESYRSFRMGDFRIILNLTGASETKMYEFLGKMSYAEKRKSVLADRKKGTAEKNHNRQSELEILRKEIYKAWKSQKVTKEELAEVIGVTRQTIYNWLAEIEFKYQLEKSRDADYMDGNNFIESDKKDVFFYSSKYKRLLKFHELLKEKQNVVEEQIPDEIENRKIV